MMAEPICAKPSGMCAVVWFKPTWPKRYCFALPANGELPQPGDRLRCAAWASDAIVAGISGPPNGSIRSTLLLHPYTVIRSKQAAKETPMQKTDTHETDTHETDRLAADLADAKAALKSEREAAKRRAKRAKAAAAAVKLHNDRRDLALNALAEIAVGNAPAEARIAAADCLLNHLSA